MAVFGRGLWVALGLILLLLEQPAHTASFMGPAPDLTSAISAADLVVEGTIAETFYEESSYGLPLTRHVLLVESALLGSVESGKVLLGFPGGVTADGNVVQVAGGPRALVVGDHVLIIAKAKTAERIVATSWRSGIFRSVSVDGTDVTADAFGLLVETIPPTGEIARLSVTAEEASDDDASEGGDTGFGLPEFSPLALTWKDAVSAIQAAIPPDKSGTSLSGFVETVEVAP